MKKMWVIAIIGMWIFNSYAYSMDDTKDTTIKSLKSLKKYIVHHPEHIAILFNGQLSKDIPSIDDLVIGEWLKKYMAGSGEKIVSISKEMKQRIITYIVQHQAMKACKKVLPKKKEVYNNDVNELMKALHMHVQERDMRESKKLPKMSIEKLLPQRRATISASNYTRWHT